MSQIKRTHRRAEHQSGVALLLVVSSIALLTVVVLDFADQSTIHLHEGANIRDEVRANILADTALDVTKACLDKKAWGPLGAFQSRVNLEKMCNLLLGIFVRGEIDLVGGGNGGFSVGISDVMEGVKINSGEIEEFSLKPESAFIGLVGLACPPPNIALLSTQQQVAGASVAAAAPVQNNPISCPSRVATVRKLRSLLCEPSIAHIFEEEQPDGQRYTRAEVVQNMIDWIDPDDNRISINELWQIQEGTGQGEDSYYSEQDDRYRSKDSTFDSIEELRMVRGVSDELYHFLKDRVSVHAADKVDVNSASIEVITSLLQAYSRNFMLIENHTSCGKETLGPDMSRTLFSNYARMINDARMIIQVNKMRSGNIFGQIFANPRSFIQIAQNPLASVLAVSGGLLDPTQLLMTRYQMTDMQYQFLQTDIDWQGMTQSLTNKDTLFRLKVKGRLGNLSRRISVVLKQDGDVVRTLYYRED